MLQVYALLSWQWWAANPRTVSGINLYHLGPSLMERRTDYSRGSFYHPCWTAGRNTVILYLGFIYLPGRISRRKKEKLED